MGEKCEPKVEAKDTQNQASTATKIAVVFGILSILLAVIVVLMSVNVIPTMNSNRAARLINVGVGGSNDAGAHSLHITGYICNVGLETAYKTQIHVTGVYTQGGQAIDTYVPISPSIIYSQEYAEINAYVTYAGDNLGSWYVEPVWSYTP